MSTTIGAYEAKTKFPEILRRVRRGESITITWHGEAVAVISPAEKKSRNSNAEVLARMLKISENMRLGGISFKELVEEGRR